jgi:hypothetical protein
MPNLYKANFYRYDPPDFSLFEKFGHGLIWRANLILKSLEAEFEDADQFVANIVHGSPDFNEKGNKSPYFTLYASLAEADEAVRRLKSMPEEELEKHIKLDGPCDINALEARFDKMYGYTDGWESLQPQLIQDGLNHDMEAQLNSWRGYLKWAEEDSDRPYEEDGVDPMDSINEFSTMRGELEYFRRAMQRVRHVMVYDDMKAMEKTGQPAVGRLPNIMFDKYEMRLLGLDEIFRKVLGNRRAERPHFWTDREFWWDHSPSKRSRR